MIPPAARPDTGAQRGPHGGRVGAVRPRRGWGEGEARRGAVKTPRFALAIAAIRDVKSDRMCLKLRGRSVRPEIAWKRPMKLNHFKGKDDE
jgi:hypothetical protein